MQDTELYVRHDYQYGKSRWSGSKTDNGDKVVAASARLSRGIIDGFAFLSPLVSVFCNVVILLYNEKHTFLQKGMSLS